MTPTARYQALDLSVWFATFITAIIICAIVAGSSSERRSHFWIRVTLSACAPPAALGVVVGGASLGALPVPAAAGLLMLLLALGIPILLLALPRLLYRDAGSSPDGSDQDEGPGPGRGPDDPPPPLPHGPGGGIPLPDAVQGSTRRRDHNRPRFGGLRPRRDTREPRRAPTPVH